MKATKKPVTIEYYPFEAEYLKDILKWSTPERPISLEMYGAKIHITTPEGVMTAEKGDIVIKGVNGEVYPCKPDIFTKTYKT
jgi:hypothetical protein|tara:strand:- start:3006 stop:3251 length:246 start_codon:yes stop_codon:yes gene_type:complete